VIESGKVPHKGRPRMWAFGYADLAELLGITEQSVRNMVAQGKLDPTSLEALCREWAKRHP
jgi:prophage antirepressor-like protein